MRDMFGLLLMNYITETETKAYCLLRCQRSVKRKIVSRTNLSVFYAPFTCAATRYLYLHEEGTDELVQPNGLGRSSLLESCEIEYPVLHLVSCRLDQLKQNFKPL